MDQVNVHSPEQNAWVQDWITKYRSSHHNNETEEDAFDVVIEAIQETYGHYKERYKDINANKIVVVNDKHGKMVQIEAYGAQLDGTSAWILIHTGPHHCEVRMVVAEDE